MRSRPSLIVLASALASSIAAAQSLSIDARSAIFDAGRAAPSLGAVPPAFISLPTGCIRYLEFSQITGSVRAFPASLPGGPDGNANYPNNNTDVNAAQGVSGARHPRVMALVGVFTTDAQPSAPAPARIDFLASGTEFDQITPDLHQAFWIGDGRNASRAQRFAIPQGATRLFLGFADAPGFTGNPQPGAYDDNSGTLQASYAVVIEQSLPTIGVQPQDRSACPGDSVLFQCNGFDGGPWAYQWRKDGQPIQGQTTEELRLANVSPADNGLYDCLVGNSCQLLTSRQASLLVSPCCPDLNRDGNLDQDDVAYIINVIGGGPNPTAINPDFNRDGNADQDDLIALINVIAGGNCP